MTIKQLQQYKFLTIELDDLNERLDKLHLCDTVCGSSPEYPYCQHTIKIKGLPENSEIQKLLKKRESILSQINEIEQFIQNIPNYQTRLIFRFYYLEGLHWWEVARKMKQEGDGSTQRKIHNNYLKMFPEIPTFPEKCMLKLK